MKTITATTAALILAYSAVALRVETPPGCVCITFMIDVWSLIASHAQRPAMCCKADTVMAVLVSANTAPQPTRITYTEASGTVFIAVLPGELTRTDARNGSALIQNARRRPEQCTSLEDIP